jgi:hypothetical protein
MCAPVASAQQPPLPETPTVTVPPVTVPQVTVPQVTVPQVTVPTTPVTPEVTTPPVQTPTVTTPSVSTSSGAANGAGEGSVSGAGQNSSGQGSGSGQSGSGQASGAGQSAAGQSGTGQQSGTSASGTRKSGSSSGDDPGNVPARLRDRDLRRTVLGHEACLGQMPRSERRVLTLRAGVGLAHPRSRAQVQRITGLPRTRVTALERSGLRRLRSLAQAGGCGQATSATPDGVAPVTGVSDARRIPDGASIPRIAVLGARESNGAGTPPAPPTGSPDAQRPLLHAPDGAVDLAPAILFVLLAGLVFAAVREARRSA